MENLIGVTLKPVEKGTDNNFDDRNNGAITGTVKDDIGRPIPIVPIQLQDSTGTVVATMTTDSTEAYQFSEVDPGTYEVVETNLLAYPLNVYDYGTTSDGDVPDGDKVAANTVGVELKLGEIDSGSTFVDSDKQRKDHRTSEG